MRIYTDKCEFKGARLFRLRAPLHDIVIAIVRVEVCDSAHSQAPSVRSIYYVQLLTYGAFEI